jgi:hypothetical protein
LRERLRSEDEVTEMRRVERAAEKPDLYAGHAGSISLFGFDGNIEYIRPCNLQGRMYK